MVQLGASKQSFQLFVLLCYIILDLCLLAGFLKPNLIFSGEGCLTMKRCLIAANASAHSPGPTARIDRHKAGIL
jgi:hypothetical protein